MSALKDVQDILRGVLASFFGFGGRLVARAILMVSAGRIFGIEALGNLGQVAALSEIIAAICVIGLKRGLLDMLSYEAEMGNPPERRIMEALGIGLAISALGALGLLAVWWFLFPGDVLLVVVLSLAVPAITFTEITLTSTKFKRIIRWEVLARCFAEPWMFLVSALLFAGVGWSTNGLLYAYVCSLLAAAGCAIVGMSKVFGWSKLLISKPSMSSWRSIVTKSLPIAITDIGIMALRRIDLVILSLFVGAEGVGLYYMAQQVVTVPHKIGAMFEPMLSPVIAGLHNKQKTSQIRDNLVSVCHWVFTVQLAITIPLAVFASSVMGLFGPEFIIGGSILILLLAAELIDGSFLNVETALVYKKPKIPPTLLVTAIAIEVAVIAVFSKYWGAQGAAAGYLLTMISLTGLRLWMLKRHLNILVLTARYLHPILAGLLMAAVLAASIYFNVTNGILIAVIVLASVGAFAAYINVFDIAKSDRVLWRAISRKRARKTMLVKPARPI